LSVLFGRGARFLFVDVIGEGNMAIDGVCDGWKVDRGGFYGF
jgi:hypothetical protein